MNHILIEEICYTISIGKFICDTPARCFIKGIKSHNAYFACERCNLEGDYYHEKHRMSFLGESNFKRTNENFRNRTVEEHHLRRTVLENINSLDMIRQFPH